MRYSKPLRTNVDRYYRIQGLSTDEIDPSGDNLPIVLYNLSNSEKVDFQKWTADLFGCIFSADKYGGHISLMVQDLKTNQKFNLADTGFGYSQVLPILVSIWKAVSNTYLKKGSLSYMSKNQLLMGKAMFYEVIEQPELHLHPAFQAKLIDVFAKVIEANSSDRDIKIIFETHSEAMINRLSYLISKNMLSSENVNVLIFDKDSKGIATVKSAIFSENGTLSNWPFGFFSPERL